MDSLQVPAAEHKPAAIRSPVLPPGRAATLPRGTLILTALFLFWLALCDLAMFPLTTFITPRDPAAVFVFATMGSFAAQFGVLAAWLVWGWGPYWLRVALGWHVAALLGALWIAGFVLGHFISDRPMLYGSLLVILVWPLVSLAIETPLWFLKTIFGARIVRPGVAPDRPLAIGDLIVAMVITAVALTLARLGRTFADDVRDADYWGVIGIACASCSAASLFLLPLLAFVVTRIRSRLTSLIATSLVVVLVGVIPTTTGYLIKGMPPTGFVGLCSIFVIGTVFATVLVLPFGLARLVGYRLQFGKSAAGDCRKGPDSGDQVP